MEQVLAKPEVVYNDRGRLVERRACAFCWATFTQTRVTQNHCSPVCSKRDSAWDGWVRETRLRAVGGDIKAPAQCGPALFPAGAGMAESVERFRAAATVAEFVAQVELFELVPVAS